MKAGATGAPAVPSPGFPPEACNITLVPVLDKRFFHSAARFNRSYSLQKRFTNNGHHDDDQANDIDEGYSSDQGNQGESAVKVVLCLTSDSAQLGCGRALLEGSGCTTGAPVAS